MPYRRQLLLALLAMWVAAVGYLTLTPAPTTTPPLTTQTFLCVWCGDFDGSDILRNWILFIPGGVLAAAALGRGRGLAIPIALTCLVEFIQVGVPGRDPALQDLLFNGLGAWTGALLTLRGLHDRARRAVPLLVAAAWLAPLLLLIPRTTPFDLWGQWTPRFGGHPHYQGKILDASVAHVAVPSGRVDDKPTLDTAIVARSPIRLRLTAGPPPPAAAPVFQIVDGRQQGVIELLALGPDLILRGRNPARILKLDQPQARWVGAMEGVPVGDTVTLVVDRGRDSVCMSIDDREHCNLAPSLADGWGHVLYLEGPPHWFREMMSILWALGLGGLVGLTAGTRRSAALLVAGLAAIGYVGSVLSPDVRPSVLHAGVLVMGTLAGILVRDPLVRLWEELRRPQPG